LIGAGPLFPMPVHPEFAGLAALGCCVLAGLGAGALSAALTAAVYAAEDFFKRLPIHWMWWPCLGGLVIGLGGLVAPHALGIGFDAITDILHQRLALTALLVLVTVKAIIWATSLGSGTSGGVLAPLLMMGAALGGLEARVFPDAGVGFWPLVGMGAVLGGTMRSPFTGVVFIIELTHDLDLLLPLAVAVTISHGFTVLALRRSILTEKVARRGLHVTREYAIDELEILFARDAASTDITILPAEQRVAQALAEIGEPRDERSQHLFPVVDAAGHLVGALTYAALRGLADRPEVHEHELWRVADPHPVTVPGDDTLRATVHRMAEVGATRLLVVDPADPRKLVGKIALHDVLRARGRHLERERRRERLLGWAYAAAAVPEPAQE
jgi:CBS domain-containing protein